MNAYAYVYICVFIIVIIFALCVPLVCVFFFFSFFPCFLFAVVKVRATVQPNELMMHMCHRKRENCKASSKQTSLVIKADVCLCKDSSCLEIIFQATHI